MGIVAAGGTDTLSADFVTRAPGYLAERQRVGVPWNEDVAKSRFSASRTHLPARAGAKRFAAVRAGSAIESRKSYYPECRGIHSRRRQHRLCRYGKARPGSAASKSTGTRESLSGTWKASVPCRGVARGVAPGRQGLPQPGKDGAEESDRSVLAMKRASKPRGGGADPAERRFPANGNPGSRSMGRTQSRKVVSQEADRIRKFARDNPNERQTALRAPRPSAPWESRRLQSTRSSGGRPIRRRLLAVRVLSRQLGSRPFPPQRSG